MIITGYSNSRGYKTFSEYKRNVQLSEGKELKTGKTVFLSHKSEDKEACFKIAEYLDRYEIDVYLDAFDIELQSNTRQGNKIGIIERIKRGIAESSYMLVIISKQTKNSGWVPFEIGYGHSCIIDENALQDARKLKGEIAPRLAILTLEDIAEDDLPDYLQVVPDLRGELSFKKYIQKIVAAVGSFLGRQHNRRTTMRFDQPSDMRTLMDHMNLNVEHPNIRKLSSVNCSLKGILNPNK